MKYSFYVKIDIDRFQKPCIEVFPKKYEMLTHLANGHLANSIGVYSTLKSIQEALINGNTFSFAGDDWCIVTISPDSCIIENGFGEFESLHISPNIVLKFLTEWAEFLKKYEQGIISGLKK